MQIADAIAQVIRIPLICVNTLCIYEMYKKNYIKRIKELIKIELFIALLSVVFSTIMIFSHTLEIFLVASTAMCLFGIDDKS